MYIKKFDNFTNSSAIIFKKKEKIRKYMCRQTKIYIYKKGKIKIGSVVYYCHSC